MEKLIIPIILGTAREGRRSENVAKYVLAQAKEFGFESEIIDVRDYRTPASDNTETSPQAKQLESIINLCDGFIIVSPEYNHGYPGELKMMLDLLYEQYINKPVGICAVSDGLFAGARMVEQLRLVLLALQALPIHEVVHFPKVNNLFSEDGQILDEQYTKRLTKFFTELSNQIKLVTR